MTVPLYPTATVRRVTRAAALSITVRGRLVANFSPTDADSSAPVAPDHASVSGRAISSASFRPYCPR